MIDADAIRSAFAALADEAPPPERIHASLAVRARRHRQRRLVLRLAGAGTVAAATGVAAAGVWRFTRPPESRFPVLHAGPGGGWLEVPLRFRPTWLPRGYGEGQRGVVVEGTQAPVVSRGWQTGDMSQGISLMVGWHSSLDPDRPNGPLTTIDVNGVPGELVQVGDQALGTFLTWQPPGQPQLLISVHTDDGADAQQHLAVRVARSVRPDPGVTSVGPRFGWLPLDLAAAPWRLAHGFAGTDWVQDVRVSGTGGRQLIISMGTSAEMRLANTFTSEPVRIRDWSGWQVPAMRQLFLTLPDGVEVSAQLVDGPGDEQVMPTLIRIIEEFEFGPWPDMSWIGGR
ncbi:hypothetical protein ACFO1B_50015 [Dactylosporangium siamense]|uniref:Uncharacterized protein n=1 Tax=Dactylosporangium siamense TaxID=685454 RepID=A0A919PX80_9ACTN|nr:hypothetical protein [Dactylosporangium siamense]GIG52440.1 hypothetical protein Dsi01nite_104810 [Dactylosporangium siamense]